MIGDVHLPVSAPTSLPDLSLRINHRAVRSTNAMKARSEPIKSLRTIGARLQLLSGGGDFSTGTMGIFAPAATETRLVREVHQISDAIRPKGRLDEARTFPRGKDRRNGFTFQTRGLPDVTPEAETSPPSPRLQVDRGDSNEPQPRTRPAVMGGAEN